MLCTSFRAPVERALRTRDHRMHVYVPGSSVRQHESLERLECSNSVFSNIASESPGELIEIQTVVFHPQS